MLSKKYKYRTIAALLTFTFVASLFTGCTKKEENNKKNASLPSVTEQGFAP